MATNKKSKEINSNNLSFTNKLNDEKQFLNTKGIGNNFKNLRWAPGSEMADVVTKLILHFEKES
mgnify:CR=1 FL=1